MGLRESPCQPRNVGHRAKACIHHDQRAARAIPRNRKPTPGLRVKAIAYRHQPPRDYLWFVETCDADDQIGLAPGKAVDPGVGQQFDNNGRAKALELRDHRRQHDAAEPVRAGQPQHTFERAVAAGELARKRQGFRFHDLSMTEHDFAFVGQREAGRGSLEQFSADGLFERAQSSPHRRLRLPQTAARATQRFGPHNREENAKVTPFKRRAGHQASIQK